MSTIRKWGENSKLKCYYQCIPDKEFSGIMTWFARNLVCNKHFKRFILKKKKYKPRQGGCKRPYQWEKLGSQCLWSYKGKKVTGSLEHNIGKLDMGHLSLS